MARYRTEQVFRGPAEVAFEYVSDFSNTESWDPGVVKASRVDDGPQRVGSKYRVVTKSGSKEMPFVYEVTELDPPRRIRLVGEAKRICSDDIIEVTPHGDESTVTYQAELTLKGGLKFLSPLLGPVLKKIGDRAAEGMRGELDRLAARPTPTN